MSCRNLTLVLWLDHSYSTGRNTQVRSRAGQDRVVVYKTMEPDRSSLDDDDQRSYACVESNQSISTEVVAMQLNGTCFLLLTLWTFVCRSSGFLPYCSVVPTLDSYNRALPCVIPA